MKKIKLLAPILTIAPMVSMPIVSSCAQTPLEVSITSNDYVITEQNISLSYRLNSPQKISQIKWSVNDESIATINEIGKLTGIKQGIVTAKVELTINNEVKTATKDIAVIDKNNIKFIEFLEYYSYFLNSYLQSSSQYGIEPVGKYEDMSYMDQIIDNMVLTAFPTYPNQHYLKINTTKQRRFNFCAAGRSVTNIYKLTWDLYTDAVNELKNEGQYVGYDLVESYELSSSSIYYHIVAKNVDPSKIELNFVELRINSNGYIEKFINTTKPDVGHAGEEYGCFEIKYKEKNNL